MRSEPLWHQTNYFDLLWPKSFCLETITKFVGKPSSSSWPPKVRRLASGLPDNSLPTDMRKYNGKQPTEKCASIDGFLAYAYWHIVPCTMVDIMFYFFFEQSYIHTKIYIYMQHWTYWSFFFWHQYSILGWFSWRLSHWLKRNRWKKLMVLHFVLLAFSSQALWMKPLMFSFYYAYLVPILFCESCDVNLVPLSVWNGLLTWLPPAFPSLLPRCLRLWFASLTPWIGSILQCPCFGPNWPSGGCEDDG